MSLEPVSGVRYAAIEVVSGGLEATHCYEVRSYGRMNIGSHSSCTKLAWKILLCTLL